MVSLVPSDIQEDANQPSRELIEFEEGIALGHEVYNSHGRVYIGLVPIGEHEAMWKEKFEVDKALRKDLPKSRS